MTEEQKEISASKEENKITKGELSGYQFRFTNVFIDKKELQMRRTQQNTQSRKSQT